MVLSFILAVHDITGLVVLVLPGTHIPLPGVVVVSKTASWLTPFTAAPPGEWYSTPHYVYCRACTIQWRVSLQANDTYSAQPTLTCRTSFYIMILLPVGVILYQLIPIGVILYQVIPDGVILYQLIQVGVILYQLMPVGVILYHLGQDKTTAQTVRKESLNHRAWRSFSSSQASPHMTVYRAHCQVQRGVTISIYKCAWYARNNEFQERWQLPKCSNCAVTIHNRCLVEERLARKVIPISRLLGSWGEGAQGSLGNSYG